MNQYLKLYSKGVSPILGVLFILLILVILLLYVRTEISFITSVVFDPQIREDVSKDIEFLGIEDGELYLGVNKNREEFEISSLLINNKECLISSSDLEFGVNTLSIDSSCNFGESFSLRYNINGQEISAISQDPTPLAVQQIEPTQSELFLPLSEIVNVSYQVDCIEENCGVVENSLQVSGTAISNIVGDSTQNCTLTSGQSCIVDFKVNVSSEGSSIVSLLSTSNSLSISKSSENLVIDYYGSIGEAGSITLQNRETKLINFTNNYNSTPVIIAIPATQNNDESAYVPIIHSINTTQINISLCRDNGATTCDTSYVAEDVHYMVFDPAIADNYSWIDVGRVNVTTNGNPNTFSFSPSASFSSAPYVFGLPQTYNISTIVSDGIAAHSWFPTITTTGADIVGCDHPGTGDTCAGTAIEEFGYVAIDTLNENFSKFNFGSESFGNSEWTPITYADTFSNPIISVMVNSENGGQDPKYPWARSVTSTGADIRYCEADAANVCNTHNDEDTMWMVFEEGLIELD